MTRTLPLALGLVLGLGTLWLGLAVSPDHIASWHFAARWTGRAGLPLLLTAYSASALVRLFPGELTKALLRERRWWGLGFALSHTIHLAVLVWYLHLSGKTAPTLTLYGGGLGYALLYAMALTSTDRARRAMGRWWKRLHRVGIHFLWFIFAFDFTSLSFNAEQRGFAIPAALLVWTALGLRIAVWRTARLRAP